MRNDKSWTVELLFSLLLIAVSTEASAQRVHVQQPVVGQFEASTTVSVPDRGSILIGGIDRRAAGRTVRNPSPPGSNLGVTTSRSSLRASVYVHDLAAMDRALLEEADRSATSRGVRPQAVRPQAVSAQDQRSNRAYDLLLTRKTGARPSQAATSSSKTRLLSRTLR